MVDIFSRKCLKPDKNGLFFVIDYNESIVIHTNNTKNVAITINSSGYLVLHMQNNNASKERKAKPAMITITDAMSIVNAFLKKRYVHVTGTKGLELSINMENGVDYAICEICGLSFHIKDVFETRIEEDSGRLWIYGSEIIDVPIKGLWDEAEKRHAKMMGVQ